MYREDRYELTALSRAKEIFASGGTVYMYGKMNFDSEIGYLKIENERNLVAGNVYVQVTDEYPNEFRSNGLCVTKFKDGTHEFSVNLDYDTYHTVVSEEAAKELSEFLAKPWEKSR